MYALRVWNNILPPYTASLLFELHRTPDLQFYVELYYKNDSNSEPLLLTIPGIEVLPTFYGPEKHPT